MEIPNWVPQTIVAHYVIEGELTAVSYDLAPVKKQKAKADPSKAKTPYTKFMAAVMDGINMPIPLDHKARNKLVHDPIKQVLYLIWYRRRVAFKGVSATAYLDEWENDKEFAKHKYSDAALTATIFVLNEAKKKMKEDEMTRKNGVISLVSYAENFILSNNKDFIGDALIHNRMAGK